MFELRQGNLDPVEGTLRGGGGVGKGDWAVGGEGGGGGQGGPGTGGEVGTSLQAVGPGFFACRGEGDARSGLLGGQHFEDIRRAFRIGAGGVFVDVDAAVTIEVRTIGGGSGVGGRVEIGGPPLG